MYMRYLRNSISLQGLWIGGSLEVTPCSPLALESLLAQGYLSTEHLVSLHIADWGPAGPGVWGGVRAGLEVRLERCKVGAR